MDTDTLNKLHDIAALVSLAQSLAQGDDDLTLLLKGASDGISEILTGYQPKISVDIVH